MITYRYTGLCRLVVLLSLCILTFHVTAQSAERDIEALLTQQAEAWNTGDIDGFMQGYIQSDDLHFLGKGGLTAGWHATLERYKKGYPDQQTMGHLTFDLKEITKRTKDVYTVIGKFHLARQEMDDAEGFFLLVLQKIKGNWKIVADSTH